MKGSYTLEEFKAKKNAIIKNGELGIRIISDSMFPLIAVNETLTVLPITNELQKFDLIVFWQNDQFLCHYVWDIYEDLKNKDAVIVTKSLKEPNKLDFPVQEKYLLGIVKDKKLNLFAKLKIKISNGFLQHKNS